MIMPRMDGWRLAAEINRDKTINDTRLILMVPHGLLGAEAKMTLLQWFNAYINKPIKRQDLAEIISQTFSEPPLDLEAVSEQEGLSLSEKVQSGEIFREIAGPEAPAADAPLPVDTVGKPLVLVVEDHPINQKLLALILKKLGYGFISADDGLEALDKAGSFPVDLVLMDIQMPRMNGYEAAQKLRERGYTRPIIAVTASALPDEEAQCLKAGINDILLKPFKGSDIEALLRRWIPPPEHEGQTPPRDQGSGQGLLARAGLHTHPQPETAAAPPRSPPAAARPAAPENQARRSGRQRAGQSNPVSGAPPVSPPRPVLGAAPVVTTSWGVSRASPVRVLPAGETGVAPVAPAAPVSLPRDPGVFDSRELLDTFLNDTETIKPLLSHFLERTAGQIDELPALGERENWEEARRIAHTIRGSALTLSGQELGRAASRLEQAYKTMNRAEINADLPPLREAFIRFKAAAETFLGEGD
jgi:CheY-like chemotaxis protein/HPt (histidine-containing phosphotransfer) domain-containing protein